MIINATGTEISILKHSNDFEKNYISLTNIARRKNPHEPKDVVKTGCAYVPLLTILVCGTIKQSGF